MAMDEMVDGKGGLRPHWRGLLGVLTGLGPATLIERDQRLERSSAEEGVASLLPGAPPDPWRFDPVPMLLAPREFATLEAGLVQRAQLLDAVLGDLYGPQRLLAQGALPPALVYGNPAFLRPCRNTSPDRRDGLLHAYAADLVRGPDGAWQVLADHTGWADGVARVLENRRRLGRVLPELFASQLLHSPEPFAELWQDALQRMLPTQGPDPGGIALLTPGHADPAWFDHVQLARELSCVLVECGDLTVRGGRLFLKTLRGLQPIGLLLRAEAGDRIDPLELAPDSAGVPGLLEAARSGALRIVNDPGSALAEAPGLAAFLPALARRLLGQDLLLSGVETHWLEQPAARAALLADPDAWCVGSALHPAPPAALAGADRQSLLAQFTASPWRWVARARVAPSAAPCLDGGRLEPRPVAIRLFLLQVDGLWRVMQGGLGCVLPATGGWPVLAPGLAKDVWVLSEDPLQVSGPAAYHVPPMAIRRSAGDLPSRLADNFFWLGRYMERLEAAARLLRAALHRLGGPQPDPHEVAELAVLTACLAQAGVVNAETVAGLAGSGLAEALLRAAAPWGAVHAMIGQVSRLVGLLRDRVTADMYSIMARRLRELETALERIQPRGPQGAVEAAVIALSGVITFAATVAGLAAENMVQGGGRLFLDLGRRVERAQAIADALAIVLEVPAETAAPGLVEHRLRLALELGDCVITYRSRYSGVIQPGPALDLLLADAGNPRSLGFQLATAATLLDGIAGPDDHALLACVGTLRQEVEALAQAVAAAPDQAALALRLPAKLRAARDAVAELSDRISRRYFAMLPTARAIGLDQPAPALLGAA